MEVIKCPNCGSEKIKELTEEKCVCLACDNVFLVHNLSKEYRKTNEHMNEMQQNIIEAVNKVGKGDFDKEQMLATAEQHINFGNWDMASQVYDEIAYRCPDCSEAWYGKYRAITHDFSDISRDDFACSLWCGEDDAEDFYGSSYIKNALECADADKKKITNNVVCFIKKCAEYQKEIIETTISKRISKYQSICKDKKDCKHACARRKRIQTLINGIQGIIALLVIALMVLYFLETDWLGKIIITLIFLGAFRPAAQAVYYSIEDIITARKEVTSEWREKIEIIEIEIEKTNNFIAYWCDDLNNYNMILKKLEDEDNFMQWVTEESYPDDLDSDENEPKGFAKNLLEGKIEKYKYLIPSLETNE